MAIRLIVTGRVQGVYYRVSFETQARALALSGWVRNRSDGSVEALIAGDAPALARMVEWARCGPPLARVDEVIITETADAHAGNDFRILPTH